MTLWEMLNQLNGWLILLGAGSLGAIIHWAVRSVVNAVADVKNDFASLKSGTLASLHTDLYNKGYEILARGWVTPSELDDMQYTWNAYQKLGGNGTGELIYSRVKQLEIRNVHTTNTDLLDLEKTAQNHLDR